MKTILYDGSRKARIDTAQDESLSAAPRPKKYLPTIQRQGKDLSIHKDPDKKITCYLHLWSVGRKTRDRIMQVSPSTAQRFLRGRGLVCNLFPKSDPVATLYHRGYSIAEEF